MVMSTTIGIGLIFLPQTFDHLGLPIGILLTILIGIQNYYSSYLYFETLGNLPGRVNGMYEMGYMLMGQKSIFIISITILVFSMNLFITLFQQVGNQINEIFMYLEVNIASNNLWIMGVTISALITMPFIFKRELKEIKVAADVLRVGLVVFVILAILKVMFANELKFSSDMLYPKMDVESLHAVAKFMYLLSV